MPDMVIRFAREIYDKKLNRHPMDHVIRHSYVCGKFGKPSRYSKAHVRLMSIWLFFFYEDVAEEYLRRYPNVNTRIIIYLSDFDNFLSDSEWRISPWDVSSPSGSKSERE